MPYPVQVQVIFRDYLSPYGLSSCLDLHQQNSWHKSEQNDIMLCWPGGRLGSRLNCRGQSRPVSILVNPLTLPLASKNVSFPPLQPLALVSFCWCLLTWSILAWGSWHSSLCQSSVLWSNHEHTLWHNCDTPGSVRVSCAWLKNKVRIALKLRKNIGSQNRH